MKIHGLQKMTLLDFPGHVACTVFLGGCDLRCPYCHNYELATGQAPPIMEEEELFSFLNNSFTSKRRTLWFAFYLYLIFISCSNNQKLPVQKSQFLCKARCRQLSCGSCEQDKPCRHLPEQHSKG